MRTVLLLVFAMTAVSLTCVGLYGTLSYVVSLRRRELGLRLALGAARHGIIRQFVFQALRVVGAACAVGLVLSLGSSRMLAGMLYGVSAADPFIPSIVIATAIAVATLAALIPATGAPRLQPMQVLRE